jgi:hypothetical protein
MFLVKHEVARVLLKKCDLHSASWTFTTVAWGRLAMFILGTFTAIANQVVVLESREPDTLCEGFQDSWVQFGGLQVF